MLAGLMQIDWASMVALTGTNRSPEFTSGFHERKEAAASN
jgi:hypothetical protein